MTESATELRTFLIADVRGYTRFTQEHGDDAAARLATRFADITEEVVSARSGHVVELRGDEALAAFSSARQALRAAVQLQQRFADECVREQSLPLRVGIGLDAGEAIPIKGGYRGGALNLAARLCSLAGPGEVLASQGVTHLAGKLDDLSYLDRGAVHLKGFAEPVHIAQVTLPDNQCDARKSRPDTAEPNTSEPVFQRPLDDLPIGGFLGSLPAGPLVARVAELRQILAAVDEVADGHGRLLLLAGEPGVGKTRMAQQVTLVVRNRGFVLGTGRCYEPQHGVPFYPFLEALAAIYGSISQSLRDEAISRGPYLARLLPEHGEIGSTPSRDPQEEQLRLFRAATGFLQMVAKAAPVVLLLDDLHWADGSSLALLQHLARHTRGDRILLLGTYRDVEVNPDHPLERALLDLDRERLLERVRLRRLQEDDTREIMLAMLGDAEISADLVRLVHNRTDGNPFFIEEVVRTLVDHEDLRRQDGRWVSHRTVEIEVPESVRSVVAQRVSRLSETTQETLLEASIFGPAFSFDNLEAITDRNERELEGTLDEAIAAGLLQETKRDGYAFNHALTQQALYGRLSSRRRRRLHLRAAKALEAPGRRRRSRAAELAWHFLEGDDPERALTYSLTAGDEAESIFAHAEAERHLRTSLELARENQDQQREAEALEKLGTVYLTMSRYDESVELLQAAVDLYRKRADHSGEARVGVQLGWTYRGKGASDEGVKAVQVLLEHLEYEGRPQDLAELYIVMEILYFATGKYSEGLRAAERAISLAQKAGDLIALARAEVSRGTALSMLGRNQEALHVLESVLPRVELFENDMRTHARLLINLGNIYWRQGQFRAASAIFSRALVLAERLGDAWGVAFVLSNVGSIARVLGECDRARTALDRALALSRVSGDTWWAPYPMVELGALLVDQGDFDEARTLLTEAADLGRRNSDVQIAGITARFLAETDLATGRTKDATSRLEPLLTPTDLDKTQIVEILPLFAAALLSSGDPDRALLTANDSLLRARDDEYRLGIAETLLVRGRILAAMNRPQEARQDMEEAVEIARAMPYPLLEGRALLARGLLARQSGDIFEATKQLKSALALFWKLGARIDIKYAEQALAQMGELTA